MENKQNKLCAMNCHYRFYELEDFFKSAQESGYSYIELWTGPQHFFMDHRQHEPIQKLLDLEQRYDVKVIGICPEQTNPKPNNMAAKNEAMQKRVFSYFKNAIDVACAISANQVVVTSGWAYYSEPVAVAYERSVKMLRKVSNYAKEKGIHLAIEALQKEESLLVNSAADLKRLLTDVDCSALKICLDTGAMAAAGDSIQAYFDLFQADIIHTHFVDMNSEVTHLAWGDGTRNMKTDFAYYMKNDYQGLFSVECVNGQYFSNPQKADLQSMEMYRRMCGK